MDCTKFINRVIGENAASSSPKIDALDSLLTAFTQGLEPDLSNADQRMAFRIYRKLRFGDPNASLGEGSSQRIAKTLGKYPELREQQRFRNYKIKTQQRSYPVPGELAQFLSTQFKSMGQVKSNLFQVDANQGYWKSLLGYVTPEEFRVAPKDKIARKEWKNQATEHARAFLNKKYPHQLREFVGDKNRPIKERATKLFQFMVAEREQMLDRGEGVEEISQGIVDMVHSIGFHDSSLLKQLKSSDGMERLIALRRVLSERDSFAMELGFEGHFAQVLKDIEITHPTGLSEENKLAQLLESFEVGMMQNAQVLGEGQEKTIRHLSLAESPFRSCLGGSDCASRTYLTRALDPNYHYFTLTDSQGFSSGHMTIVLGEAKSESKKIKVAFVDKVQNVDNTDIASMLEGIRGSMEEQGYSLALPKDLGNHNGISNEQITTDFIAKSIAMGKEKLMEFTPHPHSFELDSQYSRAQSKLTLHKIMPLESQEIAITPAGITVPWRSSNINLKQLAQNSIALKKGSTRDKIRYIESMRVLEKAGVEVDPQFPEILSRWLKDSNADFRLRKHVLLLEWRSNAKPLFKLLQNFDGQERTTIVQNLLDTPRYKKFIKRADLLGIITTARENKNLRETLLKEILSGHPDHEQALAFASRVLGAQGVRDERAFQVLAKIDQDLDFSRVDQVLELERQLKEIDAQDFFSDELLAQWSKKIGSDKKIARRLSRYLDSPLAQKMLTQHESGGLELLRLYRNILEQSERSEKNIEKVIHEWLKSPPDATLKAEFLLAQVGQNKFTEYLELIPKNQHVKVWDKIEGESSLSPYLKLAKENKMENKLLTRAVLKSFEFEKIIMPDGHRFEIQRTSETQVKFETVMGKNPSRFRGDNRPVEQVSWDDVQKYIAKLNESMGLKGCDGTPKSSKGCYRLPTEEEWQYALQAQAETTYSFGDDESQLARYAWFSGNAGEGTHSVVGLKRANSHGLYDMHGNVWEWMQDPWSNHLQRGVDHLHSSSGFYRVIRGGSWYIDARSVRSAIRRRLAIRATGETLDVGFRLVRTL